MTETYNPAVDDDIICIRKLNPSCKCANCTGRKKPGRPKAVEFPELLENAVKGELKDG